MKPCAKNRKLIAWLALDALEARQAQQLRAHLETCEGCRRYLAEISNVTERLVAAEANPDVQASESFHRKVTARLRTANPDSFGEFLAAFLAPLNWRIALPAIAALVLVAFALVIPRQHPAVLPHLPPRIPIASASGSVTDLAPTLANYQMIANQSLDKLDELLTEQGNKALPPAPVYTASTFKLANGSF